MIVALFQRIFLGPTVACGVNRRPYRQWSLPSRNCTRWLEKLHEDGVSGQRNEAADGPDARVYVSCSRGDGRKVPNSLC